MKQYQGSVTVVNDNQTIENSPFTTGEEAEEKFLAYCREYIWNFDEYTKEDIETIVENGFERAGHYSISITWF